MHGVPVASEARSRAQSALASSPVHELRQLQVEESDGSLLLFGTVSSFYHKQLAQEAIRTVCQGIRLVNSIRVG